MICSEVEVTHIKKIGEKKKEHPRIKIGKLSTSNWMPIKILGVKKVGGDEWSMQLKLEYAILP